MVALSEWDRTIAPKLRSIEVYARWISFYSGAIKEKVGGLSAAPAWETRAIADAKKVRGELAEALAELDKALAQYNDKPKTD